MTNRVASFLRQEINLRTPLDAAEDIPAAEPVRIRARQEMPLPSPAEPAAGTENIPAPAAIVSHAEVKEAPEANPTGDHSVTLEAVAGLQSRLEKLTRAFEALELDSKEDRFYIGQLGKNVRAVKVMLGVIGAVLAIAVAVVVAICIQLLNVGTEILKSRH